MYSQSSSSLKSVLICSAVSAFVCLRAHNKMSLASGRMLAVRHSIAGPVTEVLGTSRSWARGNAAANGTALCSASIFPALDFHLLWREFRRIDARAVDGRFLSNRTCVHL